MRTSEDLIELVKKNINEFYFEDSFIETHGAEEVDSEGGFGEINQVHHNWNDTDSAYIVWECKKYGEFYGTHVNYSPYDGYSHEWVTLKRVFPKEKTVIVYE